MRSIAFFADESAVHCSSLQRTVKEASCRDLSIVRNGIGSQDATRGREVITYRSYRSNSLLSLSLQSAHEWDRNPSNGDLSHSDSAWRAPALPYRQEQLHNMSLYPCSLIQARAAPRRLEEAVGGSREQVHHPCQQPTCSRPLPAPAVAQRRPGPYW